MKRELEELLADLSWHRDYCIWTAERSHNSEIATLNRGAAAGFQEIVDRLLVLLRRVSYIQSDQNHDGSYS